MLAEWFGDSISPLDILTMTPERLHVLRALRAARERRHRAEQKRSQTRRG